MVGAERTAAPIDSHRGNPGVRDPKFLPRIAIHGFWSIDRRVRSRASAARDSGRAQYRRQGQRLGALRSVADSVHATRHSALCVRGGLGEVTRGNAHGPKRFALRLDFESEDSTLCFSFSVASGENEACVSYARIAS